MSVPSSNEELFQQAESAIERPIAGVFAILPLQATDVPGLRHLREEPTTEQTLARLTGNTARLLKAANRLNDASASLELNRARHHNSFQPVAVLPVEVLCTIFEHLARNRWSYDNSLGLDVILRVCSGWRSVGLQCKTIWRGVDLRWSPQKLNAWASRSFGRPLDLRVAIRHGYKPHHRKKSTWPSNSQLCRHKEHFPDMRSLSFTFNFPPSVSHVADALEIFCETPLLRLRSLSVIIRNGSWSDSVNPTIPSRLLPDSLRSMKLVSVCLQDAYFPHIVELSLSDVQFKGHTLLEALSLCRTIEHLTLEDVPDEENLEWLQRHEKNNTNLLPHLESLKLKDVPERLYNIFADYCDLPQLRTLLIVSLEHEDAASRIVQKARNLKSLSFAVKETEPKRIMLDALSEHQHLQYLTIPCNPENDGRDEDVLERFITSQLEKPNHLIIGGRSFALRKLKAQKMEEKREAWFRERVRDLST